MIVRRHLHVIIALLLPLMVLRAMLPAGYMPVAEGGSLHIAMCSEGFQSTANHRSDGQSTGGHGQPSDSGSCPFANAAVNAPPPVTSQSIVAVEFDAGPVAASVAPSRSTSIVRVQSARGPPSISL